MAGRRQVACVQEHGPTNAKVAALNGGQGRNRTTDTRIFSPPNSAPSITQAHPIEALS
jgi:hypothetical protein